MRKKILVVLLLSHFCIFSQVSMYNGFSDYRTLADTDYMNGLRGDKKKLKISNIKGSPYLIENFQYGKVIDIKSNSRASTYLRFDVFNDVFEIQVNLEDEKLMKLDRSTQFDYFLNGERFVLIETKLIKNEHYLSENGYVVQLTKSGLNTVLYKRYMKKYIAGKKAKSSYGTDIPPSIADSVMYLLKSGDDYIVLDAHKKRVLEAFPSNKQNDLAKYIKSKGFKFNGDRKEVDNQLIQLVRYYNTI